MNPGHAVKNGKFYFFSPDRIEVVRPWGTKAGGWIFKPEQGWRGFVPHFHLDYMRARVAEAKRNPQWVFMAHEQGRLSSCLVNGRKRHRGKLGSSLKSTGAFFNS